MVKYATYILTAQSMKSFLATHSMMNTLRFMSRIAAFACCSLLLFGCASSKKEFGEGLPEKEVYDRAISSINKNNYPTAIEYLQLLEARFPFSAFADQAQLELIYVHFRSGNEDEAIAAADRFIRLHPKHNNVDYAYYMRGIIAGDKKGTLFGSFLPIDRSSRDPGSAKQSYAYFAEFLNRFPNSKYVPDARKRVIYLRNILARHEVNVANYYFERGAYLAATNRGRYVIENFEESPAVADGLAVVAQGYLLMNMDQQARHAIDVLKLNFPEHPALDSEGNFKRYDQLAEDKASWLNRVTFGFAGNPKTIGYDSRDLYNHAHKPPVRP